MTEELLNKTLNLRQAILGVVGFITKENQDQFSNFVYFLLKKYFYVHLIQVEHLSVTVVK